MRHVYPDSMVAHLWAHQSQEHARTAHNGSLYFFGNTIYSYGEHFPIACHVAGAGGAQAILFTTRVYSTTTAKHKTIVERACRHLPIFHVENPTWTDNRKHLLTYRQRIEGLLREFSNARSRKPYWFQQIQTVVDEANSFCEFFNLKTRFAAPLDMEAAQAECRKVEERNQERIAKASRKERREQEELQKALNERKQVALDNLERWARGEQVLAYEIVNGYGSSYDLPVRMRIVGDTVETSRGAEFPLAHALRAFPLIRGCREHKRVYERNGHTEHLGAFALDFVDEQGNVRAGCHFVEWQEVERIAKLAGIA